MSCITGRFRPQSVKFALTLGVLMFFWGGCRNRSDFGVYPRLNHKFGTVMEVEGEIVCPRPPDNEERKIPVDDISLRVTSIDGVQTSNDIVIDLSLARLKSPPRFYDGMPVTVEGYETIAGHGAVSAPKDAESFVPLQETGYRVAHALVVMEMVSCPKSVEDSGTVRGEADDETGPEEQLGGFGGGVGPVGDPERVVRTGGFGSGY